MVDILKIKIAEITTDPAPTLGGIVVPQSRGGQTWKIGGEALANLIFAAISDANPTLAANSDLKVATQKAVRAYVAAAVTALIDGAPSDLNTLDKLAYALGNNANFASTMTGLLAGKQPLDATLTALAALTISNGSFIRGTGADAFAVSPIIGTVSQSGGVATGAIVERGSNANGTYTRFANGAQICVHRPATGLDSDSSANNVFRTASAATWTFPAAFTSGTFPAVIAVPASSGRWSAAAATSNTAGEYRHYSPVTVAALLDTDLSAIGWWF